MQMVGGDAGRGSDCRETGSRQRHGGCRRGGDGREMAEREVVWRGEREVFWRGEREVFWCGGREVFWRATVGSGAEGGSRGGLMARRLL